MRGTRPPARQSARHSAIGSLTKDMEIQLMIQERVATTGTLQVEHLVPKPATRHALLGPTPANSEKHLILTTQQRPMIMLRLPILLTWISRVKLQSPPG